MSAERPEKRAHQTTYADVYVSEVRCMMKLLKAGEGHTVYLGGNKTVVEVGEKETAQSEIVGT